MNTEKTGKLIRELRMEKGWIQKELASKIYVTDKAVSKWERGLAMPDSSLISDLCSVLEISISELLLGERGAETAKSTESAALIVELTDREKLKKAKLLNLFFLSGFLILLTVLVCGGIFMTGLSKEPVLGLPELVFMTASGIGLELGGFYMNMKNSKSRSFTEKEMDVLTGKEKTMKTRDEMLWFARKTQKADFVQYKKGFDKIEQSLGEDEAAVFTMVGETYRINDSFGFSYPSIAVTNQRMYIGGETIRGRLLTRYAVDFYELDEIMDVKFINRKIAVKTPKFLITIEGDHLEEVVEGLKESLKTRKPD